MKKVAFVAAVLACLGASNMAHAQLEPGVERELVRICKALENDSPLQLRRAVKQSRLGYKPINKGLVCNGKNAIEFALLNDSHKTANYLAKKANVKIDGLLAKR